MAQEYEAMIACGSCGSDYPVAIHQSVNAQRSPELREALLKGKFFDTVCPECSFEGDLDYPVTYSDMEHRFIIQYCPNEENLEEAKFAMRGQIETLGESFPTDGFRFRIVTSQNKLREKVMIFEDGLDDRVVEMLKALVMYQMVAQEPDAGISDVFYYSDEDCRRIEGVGEVGMAMDFTDELYESGENDFPFTQDSINDSLVVDDLWALDATRRMTGEGLDGEDSEDEQEEV